MENLNKFLERNSKGNKVLLLFISTNIVYLIMLLVTIPNTMEFANGMRLLDMMPSGYDMNYVHDLFGALGEMGRKTYLTNQLPLDMIYPGLFGITYCLLLGFFLRKLNKLNTPFTFLCLLPVIAGIADYVENFGIIIMLNSYPDLTEFAVKMTNSFSILKSVSTSVFFVVLVIVLLSLGYTTLKKRA